VPGLPEFARSSPTQADTQVWARLVLYTVHNA
jgi:hypothetical protein